MRSKLEQKYWKSPELAARYDVHTKTLKNWSEAGKFPMFLRFGREFLWVRAEVEAFEQKAERERATAK